MISARHSILTVLAVSALAGVASAASEKAETRTGLVELPQLVQLEGRVSNEHGEPLVGALVSIFGSSLGDSGLVALTDQKGRFLVPALQPGFYTLRAYLSGFLPSHYSRVEVGEEERGASPVSMMLASSTDEGAVAVQFIDAAQPDDVSPGDASESGEPTDYEQKKAEYEWLLRHTKKNVLRDRDIQVPESTSEEVRVAEAVPFVVQPNGEVGFFATAMNRGLQDVFRAAGDLDAQLAYARLNIPATATSHWLVTAQMLESALSSWEANAEFIAEPVEGQRLSAGVAYGNHLFYGIPSGLRSPELGLGPRPGNDRTAEWFGSVFGAHRFQIGPAQVGAGLTYQHFSYLGQSGYASPHLDVSWALGTGQKTWVRGMVDRRVSAPGGEDLDLVTRMASADFFGTAEPTSRVLRAETAVRYQLAVERQLGNNGALEVRVFQEKVTDPLLKAYLKEPGTSVGQGHYLVMNLGDLRTRGVGLAVSRRFGAVAGSLGYTYGVGRAVSEDVGAFQVGRDEEIHDLTTSFATHIDQTRTRVLAVYRLSAHPSLAPTLVRRNTGSRGPMTLDSRFNVQVHQMLPFVGWNRTTWELMVAFRNLFYQDFEDGTVLEEISVVDSPRRLLGGVTVHF